MSELFSFIVKGGIIMIPLLLASVISLAVTIERLMFWRKIGSKAAAEEMLRDVAEGNLSEALRQARESIIPTVRVLAAGLLQPNPSYSKAMEVAAQAEVPTLKRRLVVLDTVITLAPLLGLLGTITGMIGSFGIMSEAGLGQPHAVTGGVAEALIATATGLLIAIVTLIPYNYFSARADREMEDIEYFASRMELLLAGHRESK
ncbi:MAG TPA: MotA/TolQ/ExbB proton channel family protein [Candidatus Binatia bacterium]|jgi:biopolymer transport protein ExbB